MIEMALRQLGSSLVAKASPGAAYRKAAEENLQGQNLLEKGQIGTISRQQVEEPFERKVPAGSNKVVSVRPIVESLPGTPFVEPTAEAENPEGIVAPPQGRPGGAPGAPAPSPGGGVGLPPQAVAPNVRPGSANQALFRAVTPKPAPAVLGSRTQASVQVKPKAPPAPKPPARAPSQTTGLRQIVQNILDTFRGRAQQRSGRFIA